MCQQNLINGNYGAFTLTVTETETESETETDGIGFYGIVQRCSYCTETDNTTGSY